MPKMGKPLVKVVVDGHDSFTQEYIVVINTDGRILRKASYKGHPNKGPYETMLRGTVKPEILSEWLADPEKALSWLKENVFGRIKATKDYGTCANCDSLSRTYEDEKTKLVAICENTGEWICKRCFENANLAATQTLKYSLKTVLIPKPQTEAEKNAPVFNSLHDKIVWEKAEREKRYANFAEWVREAHLAGMDAGGARIPKPMIVTEHSNMLDDNSPVVKAWRVDSGVCGFAWVSVYPANSSFAIWARKNAGFRSGTGSSVMGKCYLWVAFFDQSMERKEAYARAYAEVLRNHGIDAYPGSRMD